MMMVVIVRFAYMAMIVNKKREGRRVIGFSE